MKRYLVIGSTGYIGRHLISGLQADKPDSQIFGLSRRGNPDAEGWRSFEGDLLLPGLPRLLEELQPDVIFQAVGTDKAAPLHEQLTTLVEGTRHLLQSVVKAQLRETRVVILGSAAEYGLRERPITEESHPKPQGEYGICKLAQTQIAQTFAKEHHLPVMIGRVFNAYCHSTNALVVSSLASQIARYEYKRPQYPRIKVKNLASSRDFIHIRDVVSGLMAVGDYGKPGEIYNIASGRATSIREILDRLLAMSRLQHPEIVPHGSQIPDYSEALIDKIKIHTGWTPQVSLEYGLTEELRHWRQELAHLSMERTSP